MRIVACAWDWLEMCPPVFLDECLLPLALLRLAIKCEGVDKSAEAALKLFQPLAGQKPAFLYFECRLVEALRAARGPADRVGCPSQPMARVSCDEGKFLLSRMRDDRPTRGK